MMDSFFQLRRRIEQAAGTAVLLQLARHAHRLPLERALALGRSLGRLVPRISSRHFRRVCLDIRLFLGEDTPADAVTELGRQFYQRLGESLMEFLRLPYMSGDEVRAWATLEGTEHVEAALAHGKGVILLAAHLGNWEVCGIRMGLSPYPTAAIAKEQRDSALTQLFTANREAHGLKVISMTDVRECLRVLHRNECLGILADLNARPPGAFVNFFGTPASTYTGTAHFALTTGASIVPLFDERLPDMTHRVRLGAPVPVSATGDRRRDLLITTMRCQHVIQQEIRRRPQDWYWLIQRWKTRPEDVVNPDRIPMEHRDLTPEEAESALADMMIRR